MQTEWLYDISQWVTYPASFLAILIAVEIGRRIGARARGRDSTEAGKAQTLTYEAALLGLLSLMIGFTFSLALMRFEARKAVVLEESNAIGTAALRASLLPAPHDTEVAALFRDYVDARIALADAGVDRTKRADAVAAASHLQEQLWKQAATVLTQDSRSLPGSLFVQALNEVIDVDAKRQTAYSNHVPEIAFLMLYGLALVALGVAGYSAGWSGVRNRVSTAVMGLSIATVIMLIVDLDRPYRGLVVVSQEPMLKLRASLHPGGG